MRYYNNLRYPKPSYSIHYVSKGTNLEEGPLILEMLMLQPDVFLGRSKGAERRDRLVLNLDQSEFSQIIDY